MTSANKSLGEKYFPSGWKCYKTIGSYIICAFIDIWSTCSWLRLEQLLCIFRTLQTSHVLHISMNAHWSVNQLLITRLQCKLFPFNSDLVKLYNLIHFFSLDLGLPVYCVVMESLVKNITPVLHYSHVWLVLQWVFQDVPHSCLIKNNNMIFFQT